MSDSEHVWTDYNFNLDFGNVCMSIGAYNGQIWLSRGHKSDFEQSLKRLQLDLMLLVVNLWYEFGEITTG